MRTRPALLAIGLLLLLAAGCGGVDVPSDAQSRAGGADAAVADGDASASWDADAGAAGDDGAAFNVRVTLESRFTWPAAGPITSYFGLGHPTGIDIGFDYGGESPVYAAGAGTVSFAGGSACCQYGYHVVIEHAGGFSTLYAHLSEVLVSGGEEVEQGRMIGLGGASGDADGKHLHFELRQDGQLLDPLRFLPSGQGGPRTARTQGISCPAHPIRAAAGSSLVLDFSPGLPEGFRVESVAVTGWTAAPGLAAPEVSEEGPNAVALTLPPASVASGATARFEVEAALRGAEEQRTIACGVEVRTRATQANSESTIAAYRARFFGTPTPVPTLTPTATLWRPTPTRTRVPWSSPTPYVTPKGAATPKAPPATPTPARAGR